MGVASDGYGGLSLGRDGGGGWYACGTKPGGGHMSGDVGARPEYKVKTLMSPSRCRTPGRVESELVGLPGKALRWKDT